MQSFRVKFLPQNKEVEVEAGTSIFKAAEKAGVYLNSLCGGEGVCGKCKVQVTRGKVSLKRESLVFFSREELSNGYVLACQTQVQDNLEVIIPPESRLEEEQILTDSWLKKKQSFGTASPLNYSQPEWISLHKMAQDPAAFIDPLTSKVFLQMPQPFGDDNIPDTARLERELRKKLKYTFLEIPLHCLRELSGRLRQSGWQITATLARANHAARVLQLEDGDRAADNYGIAVDVGTTTVVSQLINLQTGSVVGVKGNHNLQAHYGEDVLSRIAFTCGKGSLEILQKAVVQNINDQIQTLTQEKGLDRKDITGIVAAGNTTMSHLLLGLAPCYIRDDPYVPTVDFYPLVRAQEVGIEVNPYAVMQVLPSVSSYVGGDIVAGVLACGLADKAETTCLIDVGTNGEIVIGNREWMLCCSASAGPAFEGGDIKSGMRATRGAIQRIEMQGDSLSYETIGESKPRGICGSGLIDLILELARNGIIEIDGKFSSSAKNRHLVKRDGRLEFVVASADETETNHEIVLAQTDIDNIMRSKAAIFAAIKSLCDYASIKFGDLHRIFIAGGFGNYLNIDKAIGIGLIPDVPRDRIEFIGNSSLMGARMILLSIHTYQRAVDIARAMTNVELSRFAPFADEYMAALYLPHIDHKLLFPSVNY